MESVDRVGTVVSVNIDGTVNVSWGGEQVTESLVCLGSYMDRAVGDRVLVRARGGQLVVQGRDGLPAVTPEPAAEWTVGDGPKAAPWVELSALWAQLGADGRVSALYGQRVTPAPVPGPGDPAQQTVAAVEFGRYRDGGIVGRGYAEQGSWAGYGPHTGLAVYGPGAWAFLAGKTVDRVRLVVHRTGSSHGVIAAANARFWLHSHAALPNGAGPGDLHLATDGLQPTYPLQRNQTSPAFDIPTSWGERLRDDASAGVGIYDPSVNVEVDRLDVLINFH